MSEVTKIIVFGAFGIFLGSVVEWVLHRVSSPIPYTVIVFYIGIIFAVMCKVLGIATGRYIDDSEVSSSIILYGFLPTLLFSETMHINLLHFRQTFVQSSILAGPGGVIVACILAMCSYLCLPFNWSMNYNFLFGSIMCATDPVSVVSLLKSAKASSALSNIIAGESLLNDGSAMILYFLFYNMINGTVYTVGTFIAFLVEMLILSPLVGFVIGLLCFYLSRRTSRPTNLNIDFQILFCFLSAYGSYYVAGSLLQISGVLACCAAGVTVAVLVNPSIVEHERMHEVWHIAEWVCNTLIFLLGGFIGGKHTYDNFSALNVLLLIVMYILLTLSRAAMLVILYPVVSRVGMKMTVPDAVFVTGAGLRGALAIALVLDAARNADDNNHSDVGGQMFFIITGLVSMTLLINGSTAGRLLLWLKLVEDPNAPMSLQTTMVLLRIKKYMKQLVQEELEAEVGELGEYEESEVARLCKVHHSEYGDFTWRATMDEYVNSHSSHGNGSQQRGRGDSNASSQNASEVDADALQESIDTDLVVFARKALLDVVQARYMDSIHTGKIGNSVLAAKILLYSVDVARDHVQVALKDWERVEASLTTSPWVVWLFGGIDDFFLRAFGAHTGYLPYVDAFNERNALYVLINYIDAHEYALDKLQFILGFDSGETFGGFKHQDHSSRPRSQREMSVQSALTGRTNATNFSRLEAHQIIKETVELLDKARHLLTLINPQHLRKVYSHRAARIILMKQEKILRRMVTEGTLSDTLAHVLFDTLADESNRINTERALHDRRLIAETRTRKVEEEKEMRESLAAVTSGGVAMNSALSFSHSAHGPAGSQSIRPSDAANSAGSPSKTALYRVNTKDDERGSIASTLVAARTSLRAHLTGEDAVRASISSARPRPIAPLTTASSTSSVSPVPGSPAQSPTSAHEAQGGTFSAYADVEQGPGSSGSGGGDTHNPLNS